MYSKTQQKGLVLFAMVLVVFLTASSMFFVAMSNREGSAGSEVTQKIEAREQLLSAKYALLNYAMNYSDYYISGPGRLPCPDILEGDDSEAPYGNGTWTWCDSAYYRHRLPEYTDLPTGTRYRFTDDYLASIDQRLWYAVSPNFAHLTYPNADKQLDPINSASAGAFTLDGEADYVAIIIAPGEGLEDQTRPSTYYYDNFNDYLESTNAPWFSTDFVSDDGSDPNNLNDQAIGISRSELMSVVTSKVISKLKPVLHSYHEINGTFPVDNTALDTAIANAIIADASLAWYVNDEWDQVDTYTYFPDDGDEDSDDEATIVFDDCDLTYTFRYLNEPAGVEIPDDPSNDITKVSREPLIAMGPMEC